MDRSLLLNLVLGYKLVKAPTHIRRYKIAFVWSRQDLLHKLMVLIQVCDFHTPVLELV